jgi:hypothetical protein
MDFGCGRAREVDILPTAGTAYPFAEFAAAAGTEDGACGSAHLDRLSGPSSISVLRILLLTTSVAEAKIAWDFGHSALTEISAALFGAQIHI